jgi:hypothetical protein
VEAIRDIKRIFLLLFFKKHANKEIPKKEKISLLGVSKLKKSIGFSKIKNSILSI